MGFNWAFKGVNNITISEGCTKIDFIESFMWLETIKLKHLILRVKVPDIFV